MTFPNRWARAEMVRVTPSSPCPVCKKPDWCLVAPDGFAVICGRVESAKRCRDAGWLHRLADPVPPIPPKPKGTTMHPKNWAAEAKTFAANLDAPRRAKLAAHLGLPLDALDVLPLLGFSPDAKGPYFTFPECDHAGMVIGLNRRFTDGLKKMIGGGKRGLTLPDGWRGRAGPLLIVEGPTDTVSLIAAGLCAIGRPNNTGGVSLLTKLLRDWPAERRIVVVGENDDKESGEWPGRIGAESTARQLAKSLNRPVRWALPPVGSKDARHWLTAPERGETLWTERGRELLAFLEATAVPINPPAHSPGANVPADEPNDDPDNPHRLAVGFRVGMSDTLRFWRGDFLRWQSGAYRTVADSDIRGELTEWNRREFIALNLRDLEAWKARGKQGEPPPVTRKVTTRLLGDVMNALRGASLLPSSIDAPTWIDGATGPDPVNLLSLRNGLLDIPANRLLAASSSLFTLNASPFDFEPDAPVPSDWLRFLARLWPDDPSSVATLQEWFGYLLTADTRQQKMLFLIGPKRSGKGTICRVLRALVGTSNVAGPTLGSLAANFGLAPLLGKTVAIVSDARLSPRADAATITERLLSITGEDALTVDRKHRDPLTVKLSARFVIGSNELPRLGDASGALAGRLILLRFTKTFFGCEDHGLTDRLLLELPGILNWSLEGWRRLRDRGRFVQPPSGSELLADLEDLSSPVGAFVRERCRVEAGARVEVGELYAAWRKWCEEHGRKEPGTEQTFGRDIRAAVPTLNIRRPKQCGERWREYIGIRLREPDELEVVESESESAPCGSAGSAVQPIARDTKTEGESSTREHEEQEHIRVVGAMAGTVDPADPADGAPVDLTDAAADRLREWNRQATERDRNRG